MSQMTSNRMASPYMTFRMLSFMGMKEISQRQKPKTIRAIKTPAILFVPQKW